MSLEENKALVRRFIEAFNKQDVSLLVDLTAPNYVNYTKGYAIEGAEQAVKLDIKGFPDIHMTIEDLIAEGDKVCVRMTLTGTHTGEYLGVAPTGKKIRIRNICIYRIVDGKIAEGWTDFNFYQDVLDSFEKIGFIEYTEKA